MSQKFNRITIEPAANGFIMEIESDDSDKKFVYQTMRATLRELKKVLNVKDPETED